jgi:ubiquinone/menaquinone biosynthesis C-methylase UbiE
VLAEFARQVVQADASLPMLQVSRDDHPELGRRHVQADAARIGLADGSVDLVFCHRMLHHIHNPETRARMFSELARVSRRYVVLSFYAPGYRDYLRWLSSAVRRDARRYHRPATRQQFFDDAAVAGLHVLRTSRLKQFSSAGLFCLFERTGPQVPKAR